MRLAHSLEHDLLKDKGFRRSLHRIFNLTLFQGLSVLIVLVYCKSE